MENFNRIQAYLLNRMNGEDRNRFEAEVRTNEALGIELETQRLEQQVVEEIETDYFLERAKKLRASSTKEATIKTLTPKKRSFSNYLIALAASLTVLIAATFYFSLPTKSEQLFSMAYAESNLDYSGSYQARGEADVQQFAPRYLKILNNRNTKNAQEAIEYFEQIPSTIDGQNIRALINLGHAHLVAGQFNYAAAAFDRILTASNATNKEREEATYFKALAIFSQGEKVAAIEILSSLSEEGQNFDVLATKTLSVISD